MPDLRDDRPRHGPAADAENIRALLSSAKEESELTMCTDVDRNDKSRVCEPGSVQVIGRRQIEIYSRLIHTVDHVEGQLRAGFDALDAFLTHMWAVTVTGAPKTWAMQFIEDHEAGPRRWYGGAVGMIGFDGGMNTGLTLRTAHIRHGIAAVRAGATLLFESDPAAEERETQLKARALLETLREAGDSGPARPRPEAPGAADTVAPPGVGMRVLLVDHQDSFVHTLAGYFREAGAEVTTLRAGFDTGLLDAYAPDLVVLSPGPGRPADFGCDGLLKVLDERGTAAFGVCLGMQAMVEHAGGQLGVLASPAHGKPGSVQILGGAAVRAAGRAARGVHRRAVSLAARDPGRGHRRLHGDRGDPGRRGDGDRGRRGRAVGGAVPPGVDHDRGRRRGSPGHRQRAAAVPGPDPGGGGRFRSLMRADRDGGAQGVSQRAGPRRRGWRSGGSGWCAASSRRRPGPSRSSG